MDSVGLLVGDYKIIRLIGEGGMASVYEGKHQALSRKVAVKILDPIIQRNVQIRERFMNEARLMASLEHPNIAGVFDMIETTDYMAIVMEFLEGEDMSEFIKRGGVLSEQLAKKYFDQILSALQFAHEKGIVHRDIKPSNIFILPTGEIKLLDFGIAKQFGQGNDKTKTGTQIGTPVYMSPEQIKGEKSIDHRSDIYSLGMTLFFALNGSSPFDENMDSQFTIFSKIVAEPLPKLPVSEKLNQLISKACEKDREQRFQACQEWRNAWENHDEKTPAENSSSKMTIPNEIIPENNKAATTEGESRNNFKWFFWGAILLSCLAIYFFSNRSDTEPAVNQVFYETNSPPLADSVLKNIDEPMDVPQEALTDSSMDINKYDTLSYQLNK